LTWGNGDAANKSFSITILDDGAVETAETFTVTLSNATGGAALGAPLTAQVTITDDDAAPPTPGALSLTASSFSVGEGGGTVTITARRTGGSDGIVTVAYATASGTASAGTDYQNTSGLLTWGNGDAANKSFSITILDDSAVETAETFTVTLSNATGGAALGTPLTAQVTITDDDAPVPAPAPAAPSGGGGGIGLVTLATLWLMTLLSARNRRRFAKTRTNLRR
jgi:hypothetical protein